MSFASSRRLIILSVIALTLSVIAIIKTAVAQETSIEPTFEPIREATLSITGRGTVNAEPDIAVVRTGVTTQSETARAALDANNKVMSDAFAALLDLGVEERDLRTSNLSVQPQFTFFDSVDGERRPPRIDGYTVSNRLTIRVRDLTGLGEILDRLITSGVNEMDGLTFAVDQPAQLVAEARQAAVSDALAQARLLTEAAGVELGRVISISTQAPRRQTPQPVMARATLAAETQSVPVASGEQEITSTVTIIWAIDNSDS
ncbi:MAG: SIMPL domain-containing protein [Pseudomonadota bacterium]